MFKRIQNRLYRSALFAALAASSGHSLAESFDVTGSDNATLNMTVLETFNQPWAMTFLPDGRALVSEKAGKLWLLDTSGKKLAQVDGVPAITMRGQGGMGDIIAHPDFDSNHTVFLSYIERDPNDDSLSGAVVERATLDLDADNATLSQREIIWRQAPKMTGNGHYSHRIAFSADGYLFITSGERQKFTPAQNMAMNLGKIVRIRPDGTVPQDNPFYRNGAITEQIWSLGHRNPLGIDFDSQGRLWAHEMGPRHGDELNIIMRARNYGYPNVSQGDHYSGVKIPNHEDFPIYKSPIVAWVPAISPAGFIIYKGDKYPDWQGDGFIGGLSSQALVRVEFGDPSSSNVTAEEAARYEWGSRVREIEQNSQGDIFVIEDGGSGRLLKLSVK